MKSDILKSKVDEVFIMVIQTRDYTVEKFDDFVELPDNKDKLFEFIGGEIVEVPSNPYSSYISGWIQTFINMYLLDHPIGFTTGEQGGYMVSGERYAPDVAYISRAKQKSLVREGYNPNPPDLAVEVVSPTDTDRRLSLKIANYLAAETVVWVIYPEAYEVEVYKPSQPVQIFGIEDVLHGGDILPGLEITVRSILHRVEESNE
jgi:Uma2 family endonuclease